MKKNIILFLLIFGFSLIAGYIPVHAEQTSTEANKEWTMQASLPQDRTSAATAVVDGKIYVLGGTYKGKTTDTNYMYDPNNNTWIQKKSMPIAVSSTSVAVVGKKIYVIGGVSWDPAFSYRKTVLIYDTQSDSWDKGSEIPVEKKIVFSTASVVDKKIYVMGGSYESLSTNYCYDTETDTWIKKKNIPVPSAGATSQTIDGKIYLIGGGDTSIVSNPKINNTIYEYDPNEDTWLKKQELITGAQYQTSTVLNGKIFIMGGQTADDRPSSKVQVYNPKDNSISDFKAFKYARLAAGAATVGNNLYIIGGQSNTGTISDQQYGLYHFVEMYSVEQDSEDSSGGGETPTTPEEPTEEQDGNRAILVVTMSTGLEKEFDLSMEEVNDFINWYDQKAAGTGPDRYEIDKHDNNIGPFKNRKDHVIFKNILTFEVNEYTK
ncbi:kelch repeat-containing protein [Bacillus atrophaeus]|uniref:Kelch repeat-containing protein n=1 Tax=Bacillus atrophaeus TaxID=1452 RepID=UPI002E1D9222|nr:kelch repeat-containing protein [Bacillus atrophaeus]MED4819614.1 kelch repeat-containing protein [Bacillus atrophaeus]